ncbi:MAG: PKD domain-containing protein, partial [Bacteroidia bacterium]|nr:PKD domain-containing protein [Bacteroidia bacterium]
VTLRWTISSGICPVSIDDVVITIYDLPTIANAGPDQNSCNVTGTILAGNVPAAGTGTWSVVSGTATITSPNSPTSTVTGLVVGTATLRWTISNGSCSSTSDDMDINIANSVSANAGPDQSTCANASTATLAGSVIGAAGGIWTSTGSGTFTPDNITLNATYTPSAADILAGTVTITLTSTGNGLCSAAADNMTLTITPKPAANAGVDQTVCANTSSVPLAGAVTVASGGAWTSNGSGTFIPNSNVLNATYIPSAADTITGKVTLVLTTTGNGTCIAVTDTMILTINPGIYVSAGPDQSKCANNAVISLNGSVIGGTTTGTWTTSGTGTFTPSNTALNATYTPSAADTTAGTITLTLTSTGNGLCNAVSDAMVLTITGAPSANAGPDQTICGNAAATLAGSIIKGAGTGIWSSLGTGTFNNSALLNAIYTPSTADTIAGSVKLVLTSTNNGGCAAVTDTMRITLLHMPTVNAGVNQTICANKDTVQLAGSITGTPGTGTWTTSGTGAFKPNATTLNAKYIPSSADTAAGTVTLTLTSANPCPNSASIVITITDAPHVNAGIDKVVCKNNAVLALAGIVNGGSTTGVWTTSGTGSFSPNNTTLNASYTPSTADTSAGSVFLFLTSSNNGTCNAMRDTMKITYTPAPIVNAGIDQTICSNSTVQLAGTVVGGAGTGQWSTLGNGTFTPDANTLGAVYHLGTADTTAKTVKLVLSSTGVAGCNVVTDTVKITITPGPVVIAGANATLCATTNSISLNGIVSGTTTTGQWSSSGTGSFAPNTTTLNPTYTFSAADKTAGSVTLRLSSTNNGSCPAGLDSLVVTLIQPPVTNAGADQFVCKGNNVTLAGTVVGGGGTGSWTTNGSGTFSPNNTTLNAGYTPSTADTVAGSIKFFLTSTNNSTCAASNDTVKITFTPLPLVTAGVDQTVCANNAAVVLNGSVSGSGTTGIWSSSGTGTFSPNTTTLNSTYTPSSLDKTTGSVILTLTATNTCPASKSLTVIITPAPVVDAGTDINLCSNNLHGVLNGSVTAGSTTGIWSTTGTGTFTPNNTTLNATYNFSAADSVAGKVFLILSSTNNGNCSIVRDTVKLSMTNPPIVSAGKDFIFCANNANIPLQGKITGGTTTGIWSTTGTGTFTPNTSNLNATYSASVADGIAGKVVLILTSTNACVNTSDTVVYTLTPAAVVNAGTDKVVCANNANVSLTGSVTGSSTTGQWFTTGTGVFTPNSNAFNVTYIPSTADIDSGKVDVTLVSLNNGNCFPVRDTVHIVITPKPKVNAGIDQVVCIGSNAVLHGSVNGGSTTGTWASTGTGTFLPNNSDTNATYVPSAADYASGSVFLTLSSTNNGTCNAVTDLVQLTFTTKPTVNAGVDKTVCANNANIVLGGSVTGSSTTGQWTTTGTGAFVPNSTTLNATYQPGAADKLAGSVKLVLTSTNSCSVIDTMILNISPAPVVNAGPDQTYCVNNPNIVLNGSVTGGATTGIWTTSGTGTFSPNNTTLNATYVQSPFDTLTGSVTLTLTSINNGNCNVVTDQVVVGFTPKPKVFAGADQVVCANNIVSINGIINGGSGTGIWHSTGTGVFDPDSSLLSTTYKFSSADTAAGKVTLFLASNNFAGCASATDSLVVTITDVPTINAGRDTSVCANNPDIQLNGKVTGGASGVWTSTGFGTFTPNNTTLNAVYHPNAQDTMIGSITLTLTSSASNCNTVTDALTLTITDAPYANAGPDQFICIGDNVTLNGTLSGPVVTAQWTSTGTGSFAPNNSTLNATYITSAADITAGTITLILNTTNNGDCNSSIDTMKVIITPKPIVTAGVDQTVCANNADVVLNGNVNTGSGIWTSSGTGTFVPNNTTLNATYKPSATDTAVKNIKLVLSSTNSCLQTDTMVITITPAPYVNAGADKILCIGSTSSNLGGLVLSGATKGKWTTLGSGTFLPSDTALNATYMLSAADTTARKVTLVLTSTNNGNCLPVSDTMKIKITTVPQVGAGGDQTVCANTDVQLNGFVKGGAQTGKWKTLGSGTFVPNDSTLTAVYKFSNADTTNQKVTLILVSTNACVVQTDTIHITITHAPYIVMSASLVVCANNANMNLNTAVWNAAGGIWTSSGTGTFSPNDSALNAIYIPSVADIAAGNVTITLTTTGNGLCNAFSRSQTNIITPLPIVNAGLDLNVCLESPNVPLSGNITGGSTKGRWSTSGTGTFIPNDSTLNAVYKPSSADTANGNLTFVLTSLNNGNCVAETDTLSISWTNKPIVNAGPDQAICTKPGIVQLNGIIAGGTNTGIWTSNGTGTFSPANTALNAVYTASQADSIAGIITLTLTSTNGCTPVGDQLNITINKSPKIDFSYVASCGKLSVAFNDLSTISSGTISAWEWSFGDTNLTSPAKNPSHTYNNAGTYMVRLIASSNLGCSDTLTKNIALSNLTPRFAYTNSCSYSSVQFTDTTIAVNDSVKTWSWNFGDAGTSNQQDPLHQYSAGGSYITKMIVTSYSGCIDTVTTTVVVNPRPVADFTYSATCSSLTIPFNDVTIISPDSITNWQWNFGDGSPVINLKDPTHSYSVAGIYTVNLVVTSNNGCTDTISRVIRSSSVTAAFVSSGGCQIQGSAFTDSSTTSAGDTIISRLWDFGDGVTSTLLNPKYFYTLPGTYTITLIVTTAKGCKDTLQNTLTVNPNPRADFTIDNPIPTIQQTINFIDNSADGTIWEWDFGDGNNANTPNASHIYSIVGDKTVTQIVSNQYGCSDTLRQIIHIEDIHPVIVPLGFTPNGDGENDILKVRGGPVKELELKIYNEWGEMIFISRSQDIGWDGTKNGMEQPATVYVYTLYAVTLDGKVYQKYGDVTLLR